MAHAASPDRAKFRRPSPTGPDRGLPRNFLDVVRQFDVRAPKACIAIGCHAQRRAATHSHANPPANLASAERPTNSASRLAGALVSPPRQSVRRP